MNVCDLCRETPLEKEKVEVSFYVTTKVGEHFTSPEHGHKLLELSCNKEICPDCCKNLLALFNKEGGDTK